MSDRPGTIDRDLMIPVQTSWPFSVASHRVNDGGAGDARAGSQCNHVRIQGNFRWTGIRRVKCDEAKPYCARCTSKGRKCDGYTPPKSSATIRQVTAILRRSPLATLSSILQLRSSEEQEAFQFYRYRASVELSGFCDSSFWQYEVLQACKALPPVRHAILALSATYRKFVEGRLAVVPEDALDKDLRFALQQANLAIQGLVRPNTQHHNRNLSVADKMSMMTCSILFNCIACIQGHQAIALDHLRSGLRILGEVDEDLSQDAQDDMSRPVTLSTLRGMFVNMDIQARGIMTDDELNEWKIKPRGGSAVRRTLFYTFAQARLYFEATFHEALAFIQEINLRPPQNLVEMEAAIQLYYQLSQQCDLGSSLLDQFLDDPAIKPATQDKERVIAIRLIQLQAKAMIQSFNRLSIGNTISHDSRGAGITEKQFDDCETDLKTMLDLTSDLLETLPTVTLALDIRTQRNQPCSNDHTPPTNIHPRRPRPTFSAGSSLLASMWLLASRTRNGTLRRCAIAMLLDYPRREGVWDSQFVGQAALAALMVVEEGACGDSRLLEIGGLGSNVRIGLEKAGCIGEGTDHGKSRFQLRASEPRWPGVGIICSV